MELNDAHKARNERVLRIPRCDGHVTLEQASAQYDRMRRQSQRRRQMVHPLLHGQLLTYGACQSAIVVHRSEDDRMTFATELGAAQIPNVLVQLDQNEPTEGLSTRLGTLIWTKKASQGWAEEVSSLAGARWPFAVFRPTSSLLFGCPSHDKPRDFVQAADALTNLLKESELSADS
jgi:hypothetical protein